ncbi:MAG: DUF89 family protein [Nitrososphaeria archaeon]|nr:DUF89 family protein [Nitrososphaeria archaeon]
MVGDMILKVNLNCIPCMLRQVLEASKMSSHDQLLQEKCVREVMAYLFSEEWNKDLPEVASNVHRIVKRVTGNFDPYAQLKDMYNRRALEFYPKLKFIVEKSNDPLLAAAKIAIAGNVIDFGPKVEIDLEREVECLVDSELAVNDIDKLQNSLAKSRKILYLADNAGETVFDRILVEELLKQNVRVVYAVKGAPIINDATLYDAEFAGITSLTKIVSTGTDSIGIIFKECSDEFLREFQDSDLVISKGQANYESLNDVRSKQIFFLLKIKCPVIAENINAKTGSLVIIRSKG